MSLKSIKNQEFDKDKNILYNKLNNKLRHYNNQKCITRCFQKSFTLFKISKRKKWAWWNDL